MADSALAQTSSNDQPRDGGSHPSDAEPAPILFAAVDDGAADRAIEEAHRRYVEKRPESARQAEAAAKVLPAGSTRSVLDFDPFPFRVASAAGARLTDVDGHRYVDFLGDYTAGLLGHNPPEVARAIAGVVERGWSLGAVADGEHRLAELLCQRFPSIEQIRFTNSGTEANLMAISLARHQTGRDRVLVFDGAYHGGLLYFGPAATAIQAPYDYVRCRYNDIDSVAEAMAEHGADIACVLIEPMMGAGGCIPADTDFLARLRTVCSEHGVVLIFDEVMTSRMSTGGAQQLLGVVPDMTTLGKYLGGGMTFGAFGGPAEMMAAFDPKRGGTLTHGGTFNNNAMTMSAGAAAVEQMLDATSLDDLFRRGDDLRTRLNESTGALGISATGWGSLMALHAASGPIAGPRDLVGSDPRVVELLFHALLERGFYMARRGFIALSLAITADDIDRFLVALNDSVEDLVDGGILLTP
ncbi:MAG: aspartate aminotransferase family protein [Acidimicrobiales bacterium]